MFPLLSIFEWSPILTLILLDFVQFLFCANVKIEYLEFSFSQFRTKKAEVLSDFRDNASAIFIWFFLNYNSDLLQRCTHRNVDFVRFFEQLFHIMKIKFIREIVSLEPPVFDLMTHKILLV